MMRVGTAGIYPVTGFKDLAAHMASLRGSRENLIGEIANEDETYKSPEVIAAEWARDPLPKFEAFCVPAIMDAATWAGIAAQAAADVKAALAAADAARAGSSAPRSSPSMTRASSPRVAAM